MLSSALFWFVVVVFAAGHVLLIRAAWRLRQSPGALPWTLVTTGASAALLVAVFFALG